MTKSCMFLENGKCLCQKRYYENNTCPDCEAISNCYYKRAIKAENILSLFEKAITGGLKVVKVFTEYKVKMDNGKEFRDSKLSKVLSSVVEEIEKEENDE